MLELKQWTITASAVDGSHLNAVETMNFGLH